MGFLRASALLCCAFILLAGCGATTETKTPTISKKVDSPSGTGGIRGVVVDAAIVPIADASILVLGVEGKTATSDAHGEFVINGLAPGTYSIEASHPLYDRVQASAVVEADVAEPPVTKILLTRIIIGTPYHLTMSYDGFIACSVTLGPGGYSEECGEGVGVPCFVPPPVGCQRAGGQEGNNIQYDFYVDGPFVRSIVIDQVWDPTTGMLGSGQLYTQLATEWVCDPSCSGNVLGKAEGPPNLNFVVGPDALDSANITADTVLTAFTVAGGQDVGLLLNQKYQLFATAFYYLEAPEGWTILDV